MVRRSFSRIVVIALLALSACSGLGQLGDSISKFDQAAHSVAAAQVKFLQSVRAVDCQNQYVARLYDFAIGRTATIDLSGECTPKAPTDQQIEIRQKLMDALVLYADKLQALATGSASKNFGSNAQSLASNLNDFAAKGGFKVPGIAAKVEAAVIAVAQMALDQHIFRSVRAAAAGESDNIDQIVEALKGENDAAAIAVRSHLNKITENMALAARYARAQHGAGTFYLVLSSPSAVQSLATLGTGKAATVEGAAVELNAALDAFAKANAAIATADSGTMLDALNDLVARAQAAQAMASALTK
jgi:hypothetical protein